MKLDHRTLRAIGQDLETIGVLDFDLKLEGERCVVHGAVASSASPEHLPAGGFKGVGKRLWNKEADVSSELARIDHRFGNEGDFGRPERFSESFAIDPVQVE